MEKHLVVVYEIRRYRREISSQIGTGQIELRATGTSTVNLRQAMRQYSRYPMSGLLASWYLENCTPKLTNNAPLILAPSVCKPLPMFDSGLVSFFSCRNALSPPLLGVCRFRLMLRPCRPALDSPSTVPAPSTKISGVGLLTRIGDAHSSIPTGMLMWSVTDDIDIVDRSDDILAMLSFSSSTLLAESTSSVSLLAPPITIPTEGRKTFSLYSGFCSTRSSGS
uniref:Uncharacterized protein n=1 Tax=Anopheles culicifacies TaxID=139723 RepID=A0A182M9Q3_9DIPT